jgi:hypothetical protein
MPADVEQRCEECGAEGRSLVSQRALGGGRVVGSESFRCSRCGAAVEVDYGELPDALRAALLEQEGLWALELFDLGPEPVRTLASLRGALNLSVSELGALRRRLPGAIRTGTQQEMESLRQRVTQNDATVRVSRIG